MFELVKESPEVVIAFITALFGTIGTVGVAAFRNRHATEDLKSVTLQTLESAETAASNTTNISNGFVGRMDRKLDNITRQQEAQHEKLDDLQNKFTEHLDWHLRRETPK